MRGSPSGSSTDSVIVKVGAFAPSPAKVSSRMWSSQLSSTLSLAVVKSQATIRFPRGMPAATSGGKTSLSKWARRASSAALPDGVPSRSAWKAGSATIGAAVWSIRPRNATM